MPLHRSLKAICVLLFASTAMYVHAKPTESQDKFLRALEGIERQVYALPQKAKAQIEQLEEESLLQNQPEELLVRYYLAKSTVMGLLSDDKSSLVAARRGLGISSGSDEEHLMLKLRSIQAMLSSSDLHQAVSSLDKLLDQSRDSGNKQVESEILLVKGSIYEQQGELKKSYAAYMSSLTAAESSGEKALIERAALGLGDILIEIQGFGRSEDVLTQAYSYFKQRKMSFNELLSMLSIAKLHKEQGRPSEAISSYKKALQLAQVIGDGRFRFRINLELACLYRAAEDSSNMQRHLQRAKNLQYRETSPMYLATFKLIQAQYLLQQNQFQQLSEMLSPTLDKLYASKHLEQQQVDLIKIAAEAYAGLGDYKLAYQTYTQYHQKYLQVDTERQQENLEKQQILFDLERLEFENQELNWNNVLQKMELENNRRNFYLLGEIVLVLAAVLLVLVIVFLAVNRSRIRMRRLAKTDMLTGLFNRRYLEEWFAQSPVLSKETEEEHLQGKVVHTLQLQKQKLNAWLEKKFDKHKVMVKKPDSGPVSLIITDVDRFKLVNDTHGHTFGDAVLTGVAKVLESSVRHSDIVARLGGEEFVVVLPKTDLDDAVKVAEKLRKEVACYDFITEEGERVQVTSSFGVVTTDDINVDFEIFCHEADKLLYLAKDSGRNCVKSALVE
ncbi:diguanylate cyclase [Vibrio sp. TRT 17S01]|uniref:diguanylate cyclase n=1 Tax=Vibrio sp. TRT 17S01 TaxID=3418505 RepID=UPI003CED77B6